MAKKKTKDNIKFTKEEYFQFLRPYEDAMINLRNRIEILNQDYRRNYKNYAIHNVQNRMKTLESSIGKLKRDNKPVTLESIKENLLDLAGLRIICYFTSDVYDVVKLLKTFSDVTVIREKDYIKQPKENGYKSYHIVLGVPIYYIDGKQIYPVEIQVRTMAMDFWASMDHRISYKRENPDPKVDNKMYQYSKLLDDIERKMTDFCE